MTATEAPPSAVAPAAEAQPAAQSAWLYDLVTTADHKVVGRLYMGFSLLFLVAVAALGALVGVEGFSTSELDLFASLDAVSQASALYQLGLAFLVVVPFFLGLAIAVVPLQLGSPAVAFPRAAAASFWVWLVAGGIMVASWAADGGLGGTVEGTNSDAVALSVASLIALLAALLLGAVCVATSVMAIRPAGMSVDRVPLFSFTSLVSASVLLLSIPVVVADLLIAYVDLRGRPPVAFGVEDAIFGEIRWAVTSPQVFLYALPALGVVGDIVAVTARGRQRNYGAMLVALGAFGFLSFGAFAQSAVTGAGRLDVTEEFTYLAFGIAIIVPVLMAVGGWADSLRRGGRSIRASVPFSAAVVVILLLLAAAAASVVRSIDGFDLVGTAADLGVADLALWTGVAGAVAGFTFWGPKLSGRHLPAVAATGVIGLTLVGALLVAVPNVVAGFIKDVDEYADTLDALRVVSGIGAVVLAVGAVLVFTAMLLETFGRGRRAGDDPWGGLTLEWATTSPPPAGNFAEPVGEVASPYPLLDQRERDQEEGR